MNVADFVYSDSSSPLTIGHSRTSVSPSSGSRKQKLASSEQIQDLRATAFHELQQSIKSYNDSFVMNMRHQEKLERLHKQQQQQQQQQQQLGQSSTSWTPARRGYGYTDCYMNGDNYGNHCFDIGDYSSSGNRVQNQHYDWNDNNMAAYHHHYYYYSDNEYNEYDDTKDNRSTIGSPLVPTKDTRMMNELVAILQTGTINDYAPVLEWESKQNVLGAKQMPCGDLWR